MLSLNCSLYFDMKNPKSWCPTFGVQFSIAGFLSAVNHGLVLIRASVN